MTKEILLSRGKFALVDDGDYEFLMQWKWCARSNSKVFYAGRNMRTWPGRKTILMHNVVLPPKPGFTVDHINGDGLDNRKANLRLATKQQQMGNRKQLSGTTSRFKGVWRSDSKSRPWKSAISKDGKPFCLGYFYTEEEAAEAYDVASKEKYGEFAKLNFPERS